MNNKALLLLAVQAASLLTSTRAVCESECTTRDAAADFAITYSNRCTPSTFRAEVTDAATHACLVCLYNNSTGTEETGIDAVVEKLCLGGYAAQTFPYADISRRGAQFDNEHYAGGGEWNYEVETAAGADRLSEDASRVKDVYYYEAQRKVLEFPDRTIESFSPFNPDNDINGIQDLEGCDLNAAYCCFAQDRQAGDNNGNCARPYEQNCVDKDPADNTNICFSDHARSSKATRVASGFSIYGDLKTGRENIEGSVHCHGLTWGENPLHIDNVFKGNLLFYVSMYDHMTQRGYVRNIPGSPMCACAENMAVVTRADCTQVSSSETTTFQWTAAVGTLVAVIDVRDINYNSCTGLDANNNLFERARKLNAEGHLSDAKTDALEQVLVGSGKGKCNAAIKSFLETKNITRVP